MRQLFLILFLALPLPARADCVVLLHGLARSEASMLILQQVLAYHGYRVINETYPSDDAPISELVSYVGRSARQCGMERMHFVTHSLGGILVRAWLSQGHPPNLGRVVMLAPPNHGSELVDAIRANEFLDEVATFLNGPATVQLGTGADSVPNQLPPVDFELGVIAGDVPINPIGAAMIGARSDGTVSVASTRVEGMRDHVTVNASHTLIMMNPLAMAEVLEFLRNGVFDHGITLAGAFRKLAQRGPA
ncbi:acetyltransferase [Pararhodobacter marinus]|uniref:Acetyltransferase n=1 Tax=Pararhodobacter marinus TaxID=2184063 RepID=A0A2U2C8E2_9RHOB|nr:acetyltransferase [Pararhodobacter marinus]PWE28064.1 acetyltransferase [Pararhodobacter marinus]